MADLATLSLKVDTDAGDSVAQLKAVTAAADSASTSLGDVADSANAFKSNFGTIGSTATAAAAAFSSTATAAASLAPAVSTGMAGFNAYVASLRGLTPAASAASGALGDIDRSTVLFGASMLRLGTQIESGNVSFRGAFPLIKQLGLAMNEATSSTSILGKAFGGIADSLGMSVPMFLGVAGAVAGVGVGLGVLAHNADSMDSSISNLSVGVDKGMGLTVEGFRKATDAAANAAGITRGAAQEIGKSLAAAGVMGDAGMQEAIVAVEKFAAATGEKAPQATAQLAAALKDPIGGLQALNEVMQVTTASQTAAITKLEEQGRHTEAQAAIMSAYKERLKDVSLGTSEWMTILNQLMSSLTAVAQGAEQLLSAINKIIPIGKVLGAALDIIAIAAREIAYAINLAYDAFDKLSGGGLSKATEGMSSWDKAVADTNKTLDEMNARLGKNEPALTGSAKAMNDNEKAVTKATDEYAKLQPAIEHAQNAMTALQDKQKSGQPITQRDADAYVAARNQLDKLRDQLYAGADAHNKHASAANADAAAEQKFAGATTGGSPQANSSGTGHSPQVDAASASSMNGASKSADAYSMALDNLAKSEGQYRSAATPAIQATNAETAAYGKAASAAQSLADATEWLNSPLRESTEATNANASAINRLTSSSQALADARSEMTSNLRDSIEGNNAETQSINALEGARQRLINSVAAIQSPYRAEIEQLNAATRANQQVTSASQKLADQNASLTTSYGLRTRAERDAASAAQNLLRQEANHSASLGGLTDSSGNLISAVGGIVNALGGANSALGSNDGALSANTGALNTNTAAARANAAAKSASSSSSSSSSSSGYAPTLATSSKNLPSTSDANYSFDVSQVDAAPSLSSYDGTSGSPSYATGGEFIVNGKPGWDTNLVSMWLTHGEKVIIKPVGSFSSGGTVDYGYASGTGSGAWIAPSRINPAFRYTAGATNEQIAVAQGAYWDPTGTANNAAPSTGNAAAGTTTADASAAFTEAMTTAADTLAEAVTKAAATLADAQTSAAATFAASMASAQSAEVSALQAIKAPTRPTAPDYSSAGATVANQPSAFGSDKNASTFYDPKSRTAYMAQFGIQGDESTQKATQAYNLQEQQYRTDLADYQLAQATLAQLGSLGADVTTGLSAVQTIIKTAADAQIAAAAAQTASLVAAQAAYATAVQTAVSAANTAGDAAISAAATATGATIPATAASKASAANDNSAMIAKLKAAGYTVAAATSGWGTENAMNGPWGAAEGGDFMVQGAPGRDQNLVKLALTAGELVSVKTPAQQQKSAASHTFSIVINTPDATSFQKSRGAVVARMSQMVQAATRNRASAS